MDKAAFYAALRRRACPVFGTSLSQGQVNGLECLLADGAIRNVPLRQLAYVLATAYHETAHTMQPVMEYGGERYLKAKPYWPYVGRGYVQLTWKNNYIRAGKKLGLDLVGNPDLAMRPDIASAIIFAGMSEGWFTGKSLPDYIADGRADYVGARKIVNGTDRAADIAAYLRGRSTGKQAERNRQSAREAHARDEAAEIDDAVAGRSADVNRDRLKKWSPK